MAPKCDVMMTTVACRSYFRKREREVTEKPSATKTLKNHWKKKKKAVQYLRQESFGVQVQKLAESHSVINRWINCCWSGALGRWDGPQAGGGLRGGMRKRGADKQGKAGDLRSPGSPHPGSPGNVQASLQIRIWKREITSLLPPGRGTGAREESRRVCVCVNVWGEWVCVFVLTWGDWCRAFYKINKRHSKAVKAPHG